jgi:PAS domain S-box-containing protein
LLIFGTAAAVLAGVVLAWLIARDIAGRMHRLTTLAQEISGGNYARRLRFMRQDEIGRAADAFDHMAANLESTVHQLESTVHEAQADRQRIAAVLNNIADGIIRFGHDGTVDTMNPAAGRMFGVDDDADETWRIDDLLACDPRIGNTVSALSLIRPHAGESERVARDVVGCRADGTSFPLEIMVSTMDGNGSVQYIAVMRDITERQEAERKLQEQMKQAHRTRSIANAVLDAAGEGMILISPDLRITAVNRRFADMFNLSIPDVINRSMKEFGSDLDKRIGEADRFREMLYGSVRDSERRIEDTFTQIWPQQRELVMVSTPVRTRDRDHVGRVFAFRDVTHEREVDRMKTEFVSMVSHELRTPLTSIKGYVDLLLEGEVGELAPDQQEFLEIVGSNAERLVALINDILDISRIEAGKVNLTLTNVDLEPLVGRLALSLRPQIESKRQELTFHVDPHLPRVRADSARLTQIITNLLSNAQKYTPAGGKISLRAVGQGRHVCIAVTDTGIGLTPDEQGKLFTRFYRAQNRATQEAGGTGLGLAITRSLVEMHGGTISVESAPGEGSTFTVLLPQGQDAAAEPTEDTGQRRSDGRILIVEDEPDIANLLRRYLERAGYSVVTAPDAATALAIARERPLDLITLDVILPDADGFTVLEWLKNDPRTTAIPVIMLSMVADDGQGKTLGAVDYLVKPIQEEALLQRIDRLLANAQPGTVLIVDDEDDIRRLMAQQLGKAGYQTLEAVNGEEAVRMATEHELDAVFLDIRMPKMDGISALKAIRQSRSAGELPIIMMTASPGVFDAGPAAFSSLGIADLLEKPISGEELAQTIARHLRQGNEARS